MDPEPLPFEVYEAWHDYPDFHPACCGRRRREGERSDFRSHDRCYPGSECFLVFESGWSQHEAKESGTNAHTRMGETVVYPSFEFPARVAASVFAHCTRKEQQRPGLL
jgi:hypothetical protein